MITLLRYGPAFGLPDPSAFCMKVELLLKLADLPYELDTVGNPRRGPKGKLPALRDDGTLIGDSELIRRHLERKYGVDFDRGLDEAARATAHAFGRMLEERTYWVMVYNRWVENWPAMRAAFFSGLPPVVRSVVPALVRRKIRSDLHAQGVGRHSRDELYAMGVADMRAVATQLADTPYFMGAAPTAVDATVYAFVAGILDPPFESPVKDEVRRHANLVAYGARMRQRFYGAPAAAAA